MTQQAPDTAQPPPSAAGTARVHLDAASGETLHPAARETLLAALGPAYGDPRRLHGAGRDARLMLDNARAAIAQSLGVRPDEVVLTPSGTHAVHRGLRGLLLAHERRRRRPAHLVAGAVEHSCVRHLLAAHRAAGGEATEVGVDATGRVDVERVLAAGPDVVALQTANHEVGTRQALVALEQRLLAEDRADRPAPLLFTDACATAGREPLPRGWVAALSAHKWGGPAGVGVLVVPKGVRWRDPEVPDDRADPRTTGFENVPAALAAAAALQARVAERAELDRRQRALITRIREEVPRLVDDVDVVGDPVDRLPHVVTFSCLYAEGEALVAALDRHGFAVDSGSACSASTLEPSHVLAAMGALTHGNVRLSLDRDVSDADVDRFLAVLPGVVAEVRARVGV
ncbi:aminotransferase class V-fold PLP-dependent enzyme [Nocardioidaceae bacterium]|nr:aminotransferase class V-fold PLP-dependent enzyme [Nocardioidaceae bacterium]